MSPNPHRQNDISPNSSPAPQEGGRLPWLRPFAGACAYRLFLTILVCWWISTQPPKHPAPTSQLYHGIGRVHSWWGNAFVRWDSYWYLNIIQFGYNSQVNGGAHDDKNTAFLPAYPYGIRALMLLGIPAVPAGVILSWLCLLLLMIAAWYAMRDRFGAAAADATLFFLAIFPSSWVFQMLYAESLFCAVLFGFLALYQRHRMVAAGLLALALPSIRGVGLCALPAIVAECGAEWIRRRRFPRDRLPVLIGAATGWLVVGLIYQNLSGHPFGFLIESSQWSTRFGVQDAWIPLVQSFLRFPGDPEARLYLPFFCLYVIACAGLLLQRRDIAAFFSIAYLAMILGSSHTSLLRYLLPLLPAHGLIVWVLLERRVANWAFVVLGCLQMVVTWLFMNWTFVI